jgi:hypothetical protein
MVVTISVLGLPLLLEAVCRTTESKDSRLKAPPLEHAVIKIKLHKINSFFMLYLLCSA